MRSALIACVAIVDGMMIGIIIMKAGAEGIEVQVLAIGVDGAEVLVERGIVALSMKAVRRDVLKLSNGTVKGNSQKMQTILIKMLPIITTRMVAMYMFRTMISITSSSSRSSLHFWKPINLDYITLPGGVQVHNSLIWNLKFVLPFPFSSMPFATIIMVLDCVL